MEKTVLSNTPLAFVMSISDTVCPSATKQQNMTTVVLGKRNYAGNDLCTQVQQEIVMKYLIQMKYTSKCSNSINRYCSHLNFNTINMHLLINCYDIVFIFQSLLTKKIQEHNM